MRCCCVWTVNILEICVLVPVLGLFIPLSLPLFLIALSLNMGMRTTSFAFGWLVTVCVTHYMRTLVPP